MWELRLEWKELHKEPLNETEQCHLSQDFKQIKITGHG